MFSKNKNSDKINQDQIDLIKTAQERIKQKKFLFFHFSLMLFGVIAALSANILFNYKEGTLLFNYPWSYTVSITWLGLFLLHFYNVYVTNRFVGKSWEKKQMQKLISIQELKIAKIKADFEKEARIKAESELFNEKNSGNCITLIVAASENNVIGNDNKLIWHLSDDLKHFKELTKGHHVIMGRKTFESMPKALPNRTNIVITRKTDYAAKDCIVVHSIFEALEKASEDNQPFIIGGGEIYSQSIDLADRIELTRVHTNVDGDAFFPEINYKTWKELSRDERFKDEKHLYDFTFIRYEKK
ncbi:MAG: dihydrofolate reductase [Flavobacteriaceae bacterium]|nr:dihydrofolate reductase [Flavobacteriaceae bacterium]